MASLTTSVFKLHVETHGEGPDLLLTPGFGATTRMWDEQIEEFTDRFRLTAWDLPGHGQSACPEPMPPVQDLAGALPAVLDFVGADRAILAGLGIGGLLSLLAWRRFPDRVRALILIGTLPGLRAGIVRDLWNSQVNTQAEALEMKGLDALEGGIEADPTLHKEAGSLARAAKGLLTMRDDGALPWLAEIDVPVLILAGGDDRPSLSAAEHMARTIPNARKVVIPHANHAATLHRPAQANDAIHTFLSRLPRQG